MLRRPPRRHHGFDRLAKTTYADASTETASYDADSNVLSKKTRGGNTITFTYDALNRVSAVLESGTTSLASYSYDAASRRTGLTYGNTAAASYGYAANNDLTSLMK